MIQFTNQRLCGLLPMFFSEADPRTAFEQLRANYAKFGGMTTPFEGFRLQYDPEAPQNSMIQYPGDPPYTALAWGRMRDAVILLFDHSWVYVIHADGTRFCIRCD